VRGKFLEDYKKELPGKKFGKLTVVSFEKTEKKRNYWLCLCDCGNSASKITSQLLGKWGPKASCGCLAKILCTAHKYKHGKSKTAEYRIYKAMMSRCYKPGNCSYSRYGGRGITVCDRWLNSFEAFLEDMGPRPTDEHSIDRIDSDKCYSPDNCRWATKREQSNHISTNRRLVVNGIEDTYTNHCRRAGLAKATVEQRLKAGVSPDRAFSREAFGRGELKRIRNQQKSA
jgi:hypothetical protein